MSDNNELAIHEAVEAALNELAERLGGSSDTGGPVENATQIKGRAELGVLLTDAEGRVLGRVWIAFGAGVHVPRESLGEGGNVQVQAQVCSEIIDPPLSIDAWLSTLSTH